MLDPNLFDTARQIARNRGISFDEALIIARETQREQEMLGGTSDPADIVRSRRERGFSMSEPFDDRDVEAQRRIDARRDPPPPPAQPAQRQPETSIVDRIRQSEIGQGIRDFLRPTGVGGRLDFQKAQDVARSLPGGAVQGAGSILSGIADLADLVERNTVDRFQRGVDELALGRERAGRAQQLRETAMDPAEAVDMVGEAIRDFGSNVIMPPRERQSLGTDIASGVGQISTQIAVGLLGRNAQLAALAGQGADQMAERAPTEEGGMLAGGAEARDTAILSGAAFTAVSERTGLDRLLTAVPPNIKNRVLRNLADVAISGGVEAFQEVAEAVVHDLAAKLLIDESTGVGENLLREAEAAGGAGAVARVIIRALTGYRQYRTAQEREQALREIDVNAAAVEAQDPGDRLGRTANPADPRNIDSMISRYSRDRDPPVSYERAVPARPILEPGDEESPIPTDIIAEGRELIEEVAPSPRRRPRATPRAERREPADFNTQFNAIVGIEGGTNDDGSFRTSPAGAVGPAQVMPGTAPEAARLAGLPYDEQRYRTDAAYNLALGRAYYREQLRLFNGDAEKAAAAYNAGAGRVRSAVRQAERRGGTWTDYLPEETQNYVENFRRRTGSDGDVPRETSLTALEPPPLTGGTEAAVEDDTRNEMTLAIDPATYEFEPGEAVDLEVGDTRRPVTVEETFEVEGEQGLRIRFEDDGTAQDIPVSQLEQIGARLLPREAPAEGAQRISELTAPATAAPPETRSAAILEAPTTVAAEPPNLEGGDLSTDAELELSVQRRTPEELIAIGIQPEEGDALYSFQTPEQVDVWINSASLPVVRQSRQTAAEIIRPDLMGLTNEQASERLTSIIGEPGAVEAAADAVPEPVLAELPEGARERRLDTAGQPLTGSFIATEVAPNPEDTQLSEVWNRASFEQKTQITREVADAVLPRLFESASFTVAPKVRYATGGWGKDVNPNVLIELGPQDLSRATEVAQIVGNVLGQQAVGVQSDRPFPGSAKAGAVLIRLPEGADPATVFSDLADRVDGVEGFSLVPEGMAIFDYESPDVRDLAMRVADALPDDYIVEDRSAETALIFMEEEGDGQVRGDRGQAAGPEGSALAVARAEASRLRWSALEAAGLTDAQEVTAALPEGARQSRFVPDQAARTDKIFYSALERAVETAPFPRADGNQWVATLKNAGLKQEEIEWTGVLDFIDLIAEGQKLDGKNRVAIERDLVLDYLRSNGVELREVTLRQNAEPTEEEIVAQMEQARKDWLNGVLSTARRYFPARRDDVGEVFNIFSARSLEAQTNNPNLDGGWAFNVRGYRVDLFDTREEAEAVRNLFVGDFDEARAFLTEFASSREVLAREDAEWRAKQFLSTKFEGWRTKGGLNYHELLLVLPSDERGNPANLHEGVSHWSDVIPGVIAHVRFSVKHDENGNQVVFLEELQSDHQQYAAKIGYRPKGGGAPVPGTLLTQAPKKLAEAEAALAEKLPQLYARADELYKDRLQSLYDSQLEAFTRVKEMDGRGDFRWDAYFESVKRDLLAFNPEATIETAEDAARVMATRTLANRGQLSPLDPELVAFESDPEEAKIRAARNLIDFSPLTTGEDEQLLSDVLERRLKVEEARDALRNAEARFRSGPLPDEAPFKSLWPQLLMKRMIRWAVDNDISKIAWINANQTNGGRQGNDGRTAWFYEKVLPNEINKIIKKYGSKVERFTVVSKEAMENIATLRAEAYDMRLQASMVENRARAALYERDRFTDQQGIDDTLFEDMTPEQRDTYNRLDNRVREVGNPPGWYSRSETFLQAARDAEERANRLEKDGKVEQFGFDITREMAAAATGGFPLFSLKRALVTPAQAMSAKEELLSYQDRLQKQLTALGVSSDVELDVVHRITNSSGEILPDVEGYYHEGLLVVALRTADDPEAVLDHEAIHALRAKGVFSDTEWNLLIERGKADDQLWGETQELYWEQDTDIQEEELVAEMFSRWRSERAEKAGRDAEGRPNRSTIDRIFEKLVKVLDAIRLALGDKSQQLRLRQAVQVMNKIERGGFSSRVSALPSSGDARQSRRNSRAAFPDANIEAAYLVSRDRGPPKPKGMGATDYDLFSRKMLLDDLQIAAISGDPLPFGFTPESLSEARRKIDALTASNAGVREAVRRQKFAAFVLERARQVSPEDVTEAPAVEPDEDGKPRAGNIRVDNLETTDDIDAALNQIAGEFNQFKSARRGKISNVTVIELAEQLDMTVDDLMARRRGEAFNAESLYAARQLLVASADNVVELAQKARASDQDLVNFRKAWVRHVAIQEKVAGLTAEAGRALNQFNIMARSGADLNARMLKELVEGVNGRQSLEDIALAVVGYAGDPAKLNRFVRDSFNPTWRDKLFELWINGLLSGPATHVVNVVSNTMTQATQGPEFFLAAAFGKLRTAVSGSDDRIFASEAAARVFGQIAGTREGLSAFAEAMITGEGRDVLSKIEARHHQAIKGTKGQVIRIPSRFLVAEDEFFKAIATRGSLYAQAMRQATIEGLSGDERKARVAELVNDPTEEMLEKALGEARYSTFTTPLGTWGQKFTSLINATPGGRVLAMPFIRTPINLFKYAIERHVLTGWMLKEVREDWKAGGARRDLVIARQAFGTGIAYLIYNLALEGIITGAEPPDDRGQRETLRATGWQPYSIKIGDTYYSYARLDPWSTVLGLAADFGGGNRPADPEGDQMDAIAQVTMAVLAQIKNKTFLSGLGAIVEAVEDPGRYGQNFFARLAATVVPTGVAHLTNAIDPTLRDPAADETGFLRGAPQATGRRILSRVPGLSDNVAPRRDVWGRPIVREGGVGPDVASPFWTSTDKNDTITEELLRVGATFTRPQRNVAGRRLSAEEYDRYQELAGEYARADAESFVGSDDWHSLTDEEKREEWKTMRDRAREDARADLGFVSEE